MKNYCKLLELEVGDFSMTNATRKFLLEHIPKEYEFDASRLHDTRFGDFYDYKKRYASALRKIRKSLSPSLTLGECLALYCVLDDYKQVMPNSGEWMAFFGGYSLYLKLLDATYGYLNAILDFLPKRMISIV